MDNCKCIFKNAATGMALISKEGVILKVNPALLDFLQASEEFLTGKNFVEITHPDDIEKDVQLFKKLINKEIETYTIEKRYKINGHYVWGLLRVATVEDKDYVIAQVQDINELKTTQTALHNFAYAASHDLREPLRVINGYAYMIQSAAQELPPTLSYYINNIVEASNRMSEMIDGLLAYSRINRDKNFQEIKLYDIFVTARNNLSKLIEEQNATVTFKGNAKLNCVKGQLVQLIQNLIDNAIKYKHPERPPIVEVIVQSVDNICKIQIKDNGIGIPTKQFNHLFKMFKRLHPEIGKGQGIGLALVKQIVDNHNGQIYVESEEDKGTSFFIRLPLKPKLL